MEKRLSDYRIKLLVGHLFELDERGGIYRQHISFMITDIIVRGKGGEENGKWWHGFSIAVESLVVFEDERKVKNDQR